MCKYSKVLFFLNFIIYSCQYLHGYPCDICGKLAIHPTDKMQNQSKAKKIIWNNVVHQKICTEEMEKEMEMAFKLKM